MMVEHASHDVVVCIHNAPREVERCLAALALEIGQGVDSVIMVDDCSSAETAAILRRFVDSGTNFVLLTNLERKGYTKSANRGLKFSRAGVCTLLNSDTLVSPGWARKILAKFAENPWVGIVGPLSNAASYQSVPSTEGTSHQTAVNGLPHGVLPMDIDGKCEAWANAGGSPYVPLIHGFCYSISRACLDDVGYLDELNFPMGYGEENDYCIRVTDAGFALCVALDTFVFHEKSKSYQSVERIRLMQEGWNALVRKHGLRRLQHAIETMKAQPDLARVRSLVAETYYQGLNAEWSGRSEAQWMRLSQELKVIAFYLPQFHPTAENDKNWGPGFTEWNNVISARPRFPGHAQPKLPGQLGFYDLRAAEVMHHQAALASAGGVSGFCFYYYRFGKQRLLDKPLDTYRTSGPDFPYCYCWANESWTRAWDGLSSDVLYKQEYGEEMIAGLVDDLQTAFADPRYIRIDGKPVFLIYQVAEVPDAARWLARLRSELAKRTRGDCLIGSVFSPAFRREMLEYVDFVVQFPPHRIPRDMSRKTIPVAAMQPYEPERKDYYESYDDVVRQALAGPGIMPNMLMGVCPDWDNTPRRKTNAHTLVGANPEKFEAWVRQAAGLARQAAREGNAVAPIVFVNAWNEWAEGAVLEPSKEHGSAYLDALKRGLDLN